jgi:hypothetical protein
MLSSIGTRVVSGFGGMWDRIDSNMPPGELYIRTKIRDKGEISADIGAKSGFPL